MRQAAPSHLIESNPVRPDGFGQTAGVFWGLLAGQGLADPPQGCSAHLNGLQPGLCRVLAAARHVLDGTEKFQSCPKGSEEKARPLSREPWPTIHTRNGILARSGGGSGRGERLFSFAALSLIHGRAKKISQRSTCSLFLVGGPFWRDLAGANAASDLRWNAGRKGLLQLAVQLVFKVLSVGQLACHFFLCHGAISVLGP